MNWTTTNGRSIDHRELTNEHLINILNFLESREPMKSKETQYKYDVLRCEAMGRGLLWRKYKAYPLSDGDLEGIRLARDRRETGYYDRPSKEPARNEYGDLRSQFEFYGTSTGRLSSLDYPDMERRILPVTLGELHYGAKFRRKGVPGARVHMKLAPTLHLSSQVELGSKGERCLVANLETGSAYYMASRQEVIVRG